jgi:hypothetical protein
MNFFLSRVREVFDCLVQTSAAKTPVEKVLDAMHAEKQRSTMQDDVSHRTCTMTL